MGDALHHYQESQIRRSLETCRQSANRRAMIDPLAFAVGLLAAVAFAATLTLWLCGYSGK